MNKSELRQDESLKTSGGGGSHEKLWVSKSGWLVLPLLLAGAILPIVFYIMAAVNLGGGFVGTYWYLIPALIFWSIGMLVCLSGFLTIQPNESRVLTLFGDYLGTEKRSGFWWVYPFMEKRKVSLRSHNLNGERLKVNDRNGNPIEIAAVVVWRVKNTAMACFDVENYEEYVRIQSESAVRYLASSYAYDGENETDITLRGGGEEVNKDLVDQLHERFMKAGIEVEEARITHLAYAPEIAQAMLKRQQAEAIIAARQKIVHGAVSMVEMALEELAAKKVVELDEERKAAMVSNLLVVLCAENDVSPVINTGTLYH